MLLLIRHFLLPYAAFAMPLIDAFDAPFAMPLMFTLMPPPPPGYLLILFSPLILLMPCRHDDY